MIQFNKIFIQLKNQGIAHHYSKISAKLSPQKRYFFSGKFYCCSSWWTNCSWGEHSLWFVEPCRFLYLLTISTSMPLLACLYQTNKILILLHQSSHKIQNINPTTHYEGGLSLALLVLSHDHGLRNFWPVGRTSCRGRDTRTHRIYEVDHKMIIHVWRLNTEVLAFRV